MEHIRDPQDAGCQPQPSPRRLRRSVVVIGGGQAGLAVGYFLKAQGSDFTILEAADEPAAAWRKRWDSLRLFTPRRYSGLPGMAMPGDPDAYPTRDEVANYLTAYAERHALPIELGHPVRRMATPDGRFLVETDAETYEAEQVVVATGPFQIPFVPPIADRLDPEVRQLHSSDYRASHDVPQGTVLVVGGGNTGLQIAEELSRSHQVHLSIGSRQTPLPQRILGRDLFWYLEATGLIHKSVDSRIGHRMKGRDTLIGSRPRTIRRRHGVQVHGRAVGAAGRTVRFADGGAVEADSVVWATGFRVDHSWIEAPAFDERGSAVHRRGVTGVPGLYFLGLSWLHTRGSALLGWVADDAEHIAGQIRLFPAAAPRSSPAEHVA